MAEPITSEQVNWGKGDSLAVSFPDPCLGMAPGSWFRQAGKNGAGGGGCSHAGSGCHCSGEEHVPTPSPKGLQAPQGS